MPTLDVSQTSIALALIGGWISICGLITFVLKEKLYLSEPLLCLVFGILIGPSSLGWLVPLDWTEDQQSLNEVTYQSVRVVIGIQVLFAGITLPKAYLKKQLQSLIILLGPVMLFAWGMSSLIIWGLFRQLTFLEAMVVASAVTPTDPVLANSITKGRFAEKHVPENVRNIIVAESGANDGLGFPFIYLALYLILWPNPNYTPVQSAGGAIAKWVYEVWLYQIALSIVEGLFIGYVARKALKYARLHQYVEHTSFLAYGVGLAFLTLGVVGMVGGDDILCCFIAGNSFTWDDYYRLETEDSSFQDVIDTLLNSAVFTYIGALIPWGELTNHLYGLTIWRFVVAAILILIFRRLPFVVGLTRWTPAFTTYRESTFAGFFGPIGVSAVFYVQVALRVLPDDEANHRLRTVITPIVYFIIFSSILVHGCTIPLVKGFAPVHTFIRTFSHSTKLSPKITDASAAPSFTLESDPTPPRAGSLVVSFHDPPMFNAAGGLVPVSSDHHLREEDLGEALPIDPTTTPRRRVQIQLDPISSETPTINAGEIDGEEARLRAGRGGAGREEERRVDAKAGGNGEEGGA